MFTSFPETNGFPNSTGLFGINSAHKLYANLLQIHFSISVPFKISSWYNSNNNEYSQFMYKNTASLLLKSRLASCKRTINLGQLVVALFSSGTGNNVVWRIRCRSLGLTFLKQEKNYSPLSALLLHACFNWKSLHAERWRPAHPIRET